MSKQGFSGPIFFTKSGHPIYQFAGSYAFLDAFYSENGMFPILFRELREHEKSFDIENPRDFTGRICLWEFSTAKYIQLSRINRYRVNRYKILNRYAFW